MAKWIYALLNLVRLLDDFCWCCVNAISEYNYLCHLRNLRHRCDPAEIFERIENVLMKNIGYYMLQQMTVI